MIRNAFDYATRNSAEKALRYFVTEAQRRIDVPEAHWRTTVRLPTMAAARVASRLKWRKLSDTAYLAAARLAWTGVKTLRVVAPERVILQEHLELFPLQVVDLEDFSAIALAGCRSRLSEVSCADLLTIVRHYSGFFAEIRLDVSGAWSVYERDKELIDAFVREAAQASFGNRFEIRFISARPGSLLFGIDVVVIGTIVAIISCIAALVQLTLNIVRFFDERKEKIGSKA